MDGDWTVGTKSKAAAEGWFSVADWPSEGIGIEGSKDSTLLFELGSNDHEFKFVIMVDFNMRGVKVNFYLFPYGSFADGIQTGGRTGKFAPPARLHCGLKDRCRGPDAAIAR